MRHSGTVAAILILTLLSVSGCAVPFLKNGQGDAASGEPSRVDTGFVVPGPESYDSADTAVLVDRDKENGTVTFLNLELGRNYTLSMDGTTKLYDKYGDGVSIEQIEKGDIVDITFLKSKKHLTTMQLSKNSWTYAEAERYEINAARGEVSIGPETYKLTSNTIYLSEGRGVELMDLNAADVLSFQGIGNQIWSVRVEKGHGYLRLEGDEKFVGGWIEIGQTIIQRITEDMLLLVPEGSYQVNISNKGGGGIKSVQISRNEETVLDIGDLEVPEPQTGMVLFSVSPSEAELYVDGARVDASTPLSLEYGLHQLIARAQGYHSITQYIRVAQESLAFDLVLEATEDGTEEEISSSSTESSSSEPVDTTTDYYKVYVDTPVGAEVYLDGNYVGIAPCSFKKTAGTHVIILRKSGYETRSYTVEIDNGEKDISFSFADLAKYATESSGSSSSRGSTSESGSSSSGSTSESSSSSSGSTSESSSSSGGASGS
ncbi:MAG: PEGA domain-containing protein [Lachnospiraceae bacterium]|uniref:PEGA domain-containing protein n=1 Tax=uncultured Acetatifactor sp. TaxID=1671927 RepID=UPI00263640CE|nr:PEGA domain-containing protein [uncultured Acetatifactor sp.]MCI8787939.1 PEGA domain-containing protein [Lachnospiraceae bacterium]